MFEFRSDLGAHAWGFGVCRLVKRGVLTGGPNGWSKRLVQTVGPNGWSKRLVKRRVWWRCGRNRIEWVNQRHGRADECPYRRLEVQTPWRISGAIAQLVEH